jgi:hypothetical protein
MQCMRLFSRLHPGGLALCLILCRVWAAKVGKPKRTERVLPPAGLKEALTELAADQLQQAYRCVDGTTLNLYSYG